MATQILHAGHVRALRTSARFWVAMLAASALGTNLGDLWTGHLGMSGLTAFAGLVVVCAMAIWADRAFGRLTEFAYWIAIIVLRAAATNVADLRTEQFSVGSVPAATALAVSALIAGTRTRPVTATGTRASPAVDGWYWVTMFVAGVFGTAAGDLVSHTLGVVASAVMLTILLVAVIWVRERVFAGSMMSYWVAVLAERTAGTPIGDGLASRHGAALGLQVATCCSAMLLAAALLWRARRRVDGELPG